tara:strand:- start:130 stop:432 length:303 start_codon:yes stop_codon:yes gene_type:complete
MTSKHEFKMEDSSYTQSQHHVAIGKSIMFSNTKAFGEVGVGEDLNNGTKLGSGLTYEYFKFGFSKIIFNNLYIKAEYESKLRNYEGKDSNEIQIKTKYTF